MPVATVNPESPVTSVSCRVSKNRAGFRDTRNYADGDGWFLSKPIASLIEQSSPNFGNRKMGVVVKTATAKYE